MKSTESESGSVTIFLALILCAVVTFLFVLLESARIHAARAVLNRAAESAMDSVLSQYQRELLERYGLLFLDGSFGTGISEPQFVEEEFALWFEKNRGGPLVSVFLTDAGLLRMVSASDYSGEIFRDSALRFQRLRREKGMGEQADPAVLPQECAELLSVLREGETYLSGQTDPGDSLAGGREETELFRILQGLQIQKSRPFSRRFLPEGTILSGTVLLPEGQPSREMRDLRHLSAGEHFSGTEALPDAEEKQLYLSYLLDFFPAFPDGGDGWGLSFEAEYLVCYGNSDTENLEAFSARLYPGLLGRNLRTARGAAGLLSEIDEVIAGYRAEFEEPGVSEDPGVLREKLLWCYAASETELELRVLFQGGRIPLVKTEGNFVMRRSEIRRLSYGVFPGKETTDRLYSQSPAFTYRDALRAALSEIPEEELSYRAMDLVQENLREKNSSFLFCSLVFEIEMELRSAAEPLFSNQPLLQNTAHPAVGTALPLKKISGSYR